MFYKNAGVCVCVYILLSTTNKHGFFRAFAPAVK